MELYPWHSTAVTAVMAPDLGIIREFAWEPLADIDVPEVFAFGKPWVAVAEALRLPRESMEVGFTVASRQVRAYRLPGGQRLVVLWHSGSAGPPNQTDTAHLKAALLADRS